MSEALDRWRLAHAEGVGPVNYQRLLARFGTAGEAINACLLYTSPSPRD